MQTFIHLCRSPGVHEESLHISSALLQHASEQLHRHLDRGTAGHLSSERPLPHMAASQL